MFRHLSSLSALLATAVLAWPSPVRVQAPQCTDPRTQLRRALEGNRVLQWEVLSEYGDEGRRLLAEILQEPNLPKRTRAEGEWLMSATHSPKFEWHFEGRRCGPGKVRLSPDGKTVFSGSTDSEHAVRAWDIDGRGQLWRSSLGQDQAESVAVSPDGRRVAIGTDNGTIRIFDAVTGHRLQLLIVPSAVYSLSFSPSGQVLAAAAFTHIRLFDTKTWCETAKMDNSSLANEIAFGPDGRTLASATFEKVRVWNLATLEQERIVVVKPGRTPTLFMDEMAQRAELWEMARHVAYSRDGRLMATVSNGAIQVWDVASGRQTALQEESTRRNVTFGPDGTWLVWADDRGIVKWVPPKWKTSVIFKDEDIVEDVAVTADGRFVLAPHLDGTISIIDLIAGKKTGSLVCEW